jgi:hypothetical protein
MCAMAQKHVRAPRKRRTSENSVMAKFSIAPAQSPRTAGVGTLISSGITGVVSAYTRRPGEGLGHRGRVERRAGGWSSDPMREADAPSTGELQVCFPRCARPTGDSHTRTTRGPAQRVKG